MKSTLQSLALKTGGKILLRSRNDTILTALSCIAKRFRRPERTVVDAKRRADESASIVQNLRNMRHPAPHSSSSRASLAARRHGRAATTAAE